MPIDQDPSVCLFDAKVLNCVIRLGTRFLRGQNLHCAFSTPEELGTSGEITLWTADRLTGKFNEAWWKLLTKVFYHLFKNQFSVVHIRHFFVQLRRKFRLSCVCFGSYDVFLQECPVTWNSFSYTRVSTDQCWPWWRKSQESKIPHALGSVWRNMIIHLMNLLMWDTLDTGNLIDDLYHHWWLSFCFGVILEISFDKTVKNKWTYSSERVLQETSIPYCPHWFRV